MDILDYDSAVETLQGTLTTIKDNLFYYLDFTNTTVKGFGPITFVDAGSHSNSIEGGDRDSGGDRSGSDGSRESRESAHSGDC